MNLELISYGNGQLLAKVMAAVANIVTSPDYSVLAMTILGLATVLGIVGYHRDMAAYGIQAHGTWIIKGITSLAIFWMLVGGSINVFIYDPLNSFTGVVDNVPMGIAMPVYLENQISENLSTLYSEWMAPSGYPSEFAYDNPSNAAGFYNPGMVSPLHAINVLTQAHFTDSYFYESLSDFTQNCIIPGMMLGVIDPNQFYIAGPGNAYPDDSIQDLLTNDMPTMPTGWTSVIYTSSNPGGTTYTCADAWNLPAPTGLNAQVNSMAAPTGSLAGQYGGYLNTATGSNQTALADQALLSNAAGYMLGFSTTGQQILGQAALMNSLSGPIAQFAQSTGTSTQAQAYALTQAFNQSENSWTTSAIMSAKMLPIFHLIMEMIVVAIFPLFFALAVVPTMTMKYLKLLFELLMWLALWSPLASVINFLVQSFMQTKVFNNVSSTALSGVQGFNYANYSFIAHNSITYTAVTGAIMWIVPVLSFGLVTGSAFVMSEAIGAVGSAAHGSAQSQGASVGTSSGLQGIEGQGSNLAKGEALNAHGKSTGGWASADEKIAGMGALDNIMNAQSFGNNMQALGYRKMLDDKTKNMAATLGTGGAYNNAGQAYNTGANSTYDKLAQQGITQDWANSAGVNYQQAANSLAQGKGFDVSGMYEMGKNGLTKMSNNGSTHFTLGSNGQAVLASANGQMSVNGQQMRTNIVSDQNGASIQTFKGEHLESVTDTGNMALPAIDKNTPLGQVIGNNYQGNYNEGGGKFKMDGVLDRAQAERLYHSNLITGKAKTELGNALATGEQSFNIDATGDKNHITGLALSNKQGTVVAADGTYSNLMNKSIGSKTWTGDTHVHDTSSKNISGSSSIVDNSHKTLSGTSSVTDDSNTYKVGNYYQSPEYGSNQAFLNNGSYINNYAQYTPGGSGLISQMRIKDKGALATFNKNTADMMEKYGGNANQLVFSAKATDELEADGGLKILGTGAEDKFKASVGIDGSTTMRTNALYTETGKQLTHYGNELKAGRISWSQYQNNVNGLVSTYKTLVNIGSAPSATNAIISGGNVLKTGASKEAEIKNLSNELQSGKITQAEYIKDAEKIGDGNHKF